jgi:hypothetical protein
MGLTRGRTTPVCKGDRLFATEAVRKSSRRTSRETLASQIGPGSTIATSARVASTQTGHLKGKIDFSEAVVGVAVVVETMQQL